MPTREEMLLRGQEELKRYGGKPSYESTLGEVPPSMREEQDYRYHPKYGRYMIFDKQTGEFLIDKPSPMESGEEFDMPRAMQVNEPVKKSYPVPSLPVEESLPAPSLPVERARKIQPANVKKTIEDLRGATDFLKVLSNREKMNKRTKR